MTDASKDLALDRIIHAPRAAIWRCYAEPALLEKWFCPKPWYVSDAVVDLRVGGEFSSIMHGPEGEEFPNTGVFLEIVPQEKLVFTDAFVPGWRPSGKPFMVAEIALSDHADGQTRYLATARHWTEEARKEHEAMGFYEGWGAAADQLEELTKSL